MRRRAPFSPADAAALRPLLERLDAALDRAARLAADPVELPRRYTSPATRRWPGCLPPASPTAAPTSSSRSWRGLLGPAGRRRRRAASRRSPARPTVAAFGGLRLPLQPSRRPGRARGGGGRGARAPRLARRALRRALRRGGRRTGGAPPGAGRASPASCARPRRWPRCSGDPWPPRAAPPAARPGRARAPPSAGTSTSAGWCAARTRWTSGSGAGVPPLGAGGPARHPRPPGRARPRAHRPARTRAGAPPRRSPPRCGGSIRPTRSATTSRSVTSG